MGARIALLVERPTEKPGTIHTRVRVPGMARDFSPRVSFQCRLSYGVRTAPDALTSVGTLKYPTLTTIALSGHMKTRHTLTGMGSAVPAPVVP